MRSHFQTLLAEGRVLRVCALGQLCHPKLMEMIGWHGGYDAGWLDQEHVGLTIPQIEETTRAARGGGGIMGVMVRSAAQAQEIVTWSKFHPGGVRGVNGTGVDGRYGTMGGPDYFAKANAETFVAVQIEHIDAVNEVEAIAAIPDLD